MNRHKQISYVAYWLFALLVFPITGSAAIINPDDTAFYNDNGAELFDPSSVAISIELADPLSGEFGFYFEGDSSNRVTIFDSLDASGDTALINFDAGWVWDNELSLAQSIFSTSSDNIGFYLTVDAFALTIFSEASLNTFGSDLSAAFQSKDDPLTYLIGFEAPLPNVGLTTIAFELVGGVEDANSVPEPSSVMLMLLALPMLYFGRKKSRGNI